MNTKRETRIEEALRKGEFFLDSGTQRLLRSLAHFRFLRELIKEEHGSWQWTLTHDSGGTQSAKQRQTRQKDWEFRVKTKEKPFEYGLWAECWFCNKVFKKKTFCKKCKFSICPHCNKCGCQLPKCCLTVAKKCLRAFSGKVPPIGAEK